MKAVVVAVIITAAVTSVAMYMLQFGVANFTAVSVEAPAPVRAEPLVSESIIVSPSVSDTASQTPTATPTVSPSVSPSEPPLTTIADCKRMGAWADICRYNAMCWDGRSLYFFHPTGVTSLDNPPFQRRVWEENDMLEGVILPLIDVPLAKNKRLPFNNGGSPSYIGWEVHPSVLEKPGVRVNWIDYNVWMTPFEFPFSSPWYTTAKLMAIYRARGMNDSGWFHPPLPTLEGNDVLYQHIDHDEWTTDWEKQAIQVMTGGKARMEFDNGVWAKQWTPNNLMCSKTGNIIMTGTVSASLPDPETAYLFRKDMYKHLNVTLPKKPAKKVLFWLRPAPNGRAILNEKELFNITERYNISYTVVKSPPRSLKEQLELFASHGIMVSPHGAGLMNAMFLVPFSSVVEIFPYRLDHNLYSSIAITAGLGYYPIHTYKAHDMWSREKLNFAQNCEKWTGLDGNWRAGQCRETLVHYQIDVDPLDFEKALVNAIDHAGYRQPFRDYGPTPDNTTATGWARRRLRANTGRHG